VEWTFDDKRPIYLQVIEQIEMDILKGKYAPGDSIPSVRELASIAGVNPNTMQKALAKLEDKGLVTTHRTAGRRLTEDENIIKGLKKEAINRNVENYFTSMDNIGISNEEAVEVIVSYNAHKKGEEVSNE